METIVLEVEQRKALGKKVKALRRNGMTLANMFGHGLESRAVEVDTFEMETVLAKAGATHVITLKDRSSRSNFRALVKGVQRDPLNGKLLHVDFHQVSMTEKVKVEVPLAFQGESPISGRKDLLLLENLRSVEIECLPEYIPSSISVDLSKLGRAGDHILVADLELNDRVTVLTHPEEVIARVGVAKAAIGSGMTEEAESEEYSEEVEA